MEREYKNVRENRLQARTRLLKLVRVKTADNQRLFGFIRDISIGGMMVNTHLEVNVRDQVWLCIELPREHAPQSLEIQVEITWVGEGNQPGSHDCGCRFLVIEEADREALLALVRKYPMGEEEL